MTLASICNNDLQIGIFVEDLFYAAIISSLLPRNAATPLLIVAVLVIIAQISRLRDEFWRLVGGGGGSGGRCGWTLKAGFCIDVTRLELESKVQVWPYEHGGCQRSRGGRRSHTDCCPRHSTSCKTLYDLTPMNQGL